VQWAAQQRAAGRPVLVHCAHGHGRSATVLCAILIAEGQARGIGDAEAMLKAERPRVRLNYRQRGALKAWLAGREAAMVKQQ
jgi:protein-tyrosine phosphatase